VSQTYALIGGGGVFAVHYAKYVLGHCDPRMLISIGRSPERTSPYTLDVGKGDRRYRYEQVHMVYEQDRLFEILDKYKPEVIVNFAALAYATSWDKAWRYFDTNVVALAKIVEQLSKRDYLRKFVQIGSSEVYGSADRALDEKTVPTPTSPYAVSKLAGDQFLETYWTVRKFPVNVIRPSNAYGPGQLLYRVLPRAVLCGLTGTKLPLQGGGTVRKSYMHAFDLATAIQAIVDKAPHGELYNAGPERPTSIRRLVELIADGMNIPFDQLCEIVPGRAGEDAQYWLDSTKIKDQLGWRPTIDLPEGMADMIAWGRKYKDRILEDSTEFVLRA
jgi:dTDP-glucose 4,6-dehydratase